MNHTVAEHTAMAFNVCFFHFSASLYTIKQEEGAVPEQTNVQTDSRMN